MGTTVGDAADAEGASTIRRRRLRAVNDGTMRTVVACDGGGEVVTDEPVEHGGTGTGPSPLQTVVAALCGCVGVTFNRTAAEFGFAYTGLTFDAEYTLDVRGRSGDRSVRPFFQTVRVEVRVRTDESVERLREVVEEAEARCPVHNLISAAGVALEVTWLREPAAA